MASKVSDGVLWGEYVSGQETSKVQVSGASGGSNLDKDAFLKLLIAQMQYQDPLNPMDDKEFVAQMAQFTALEQMQNLNSSYSKSQAYDMIGRTVAGTAHIEGSNIYQYVEGTVTSVVMKNGDPYLVIGTGDDAVELAMNKVEEVFEDYTRLGLLQSINNNVFNAENLMLVGSYIQAITVDENGVPNGYVEGVVDSIKFGASNTTLLVGNKEVLPQELISVGPSGMMIGKNISYYMLDDETGTYGWHEGVIEEIKISGDNAYAIINGKEVPFDKIDVLANALNMVGSSVMSYGDASVVSGVGLRSGQILLLLEDGRQLSVDEVKLI